MLITCHFNFNFSQFALAESFRVQSNVGKYRFQGFAYGLNPKVLGVFSSAPVFHKGWLHDGSSTENYFVSSNKVSWLCSNASDMYQSSDFSILSPLKYYFLLVACFPLMTS